MKDYAGCAARGLTPAETARELGVSRQAVYDKASKRGLQFRREPPRRAHVYADCAARGLTMNEAALELGVTRQAVFMAAWRHGIEFRNKGKRSDGLREHLTPELYEDYRFLTRKRGYRRADALRAIGREDLI